VAITIFVSAFVSLTLTPMMCSRFLKHHTGRHSRAYLIAEAFFDGLLNAYDTGLKWVLRHQPFTLGVLLVTMALTGFLYVEIPKGFFPQQDIGFIFGFTESKQDISFSAMMERQMAVMEVLGRDPDVMSYSGSVGATGGALTTNTGRIWLNLKPWDERTATADEIINRLRPQLAKLEGVNLFLQAAQDINVGGRIGRTQYQYTLQDANLDELNEWSPRMLEKFSHLPELQDVATDQQTDGTTATLTIDRDTASRFGIQPQLIDDTLYDAFGQRQVTQYFTQLSAYHVVLEVDPKLQRDPSTLDKIYVKSPLTGQLVPLATFVHFDTVKTNYLSVNHQGQFPAVTLSFNLSPGTALGSAVEAIKRAEIEMDKPPR
jgi:multidrug efflux pump subunit AcrB